MSPGALGAAPQRARFEAARAHGFRDFRRFEGPRGRSGLFVASRWPLRGGAFRPFSIGRLPHSLWHLDWMVEKGVGDVLVQTPLGALRLENTHLQAQYRTDGYAAERLAQAVEIVLEGSRSNGRRRVCSQVISTVAVTSFRAERSGTSVTSKTRAPPRIEDSVFARSGRDMAVRIVSARTERPTAARPESGIRRCFRTTPRSSSSSELVPCVDCARPRRVVSATQAAAVASLERAADSTPFRVVLALLTAVTLLVLGVGAKRRMGTVTRGSRRRVALRVLTLARLGACFVWCSYLGAGVLPDARQAAPPCRGRAWVVARAIARAQSAFSARVTAPRGRRRAARRTRRPAASRRRLRHRRSRIRAV